MQAKRPRTAPATSPKTAAAAAPKAVSKIFPPIRRVYFFYVKNRPPIGERFSGNRQRPILPGRVQPSTFGDEELNFCVRYEYRWILFSIATDIG